MSEKKGSKKDRETKTDGGGPAKTAAQILEDELAKNMAEAEKLRMREEKQKKKNITTLKTAVTAVTAANRMQMMQKKLTDVFEEDGIPDNEDDALALLQKAMEDVDIGDDKGSEEGSGEKLSAASDSETSSSTLYMDDDPALCQTCRNEGCR